MATKDLENRENIVVTNPKFKHLYHCRFGYKGGRQICLFLGFQGDGYVVRKWRVKSARWTDRVVIGKRDLLAAATRADIKKAGVLINLLN